MCSSSSAGVASIEAYADPQVIGGRRPHRAAVVGGTPRLAPRRIRVGGRLQLHGLADEFHVRNLIGADMLRRAYFLDRCFTEGLAKARVSQAAATDACITEPAVR